MRRLFRLIPLLAIMFASGCTLTLTRMEAPSQVMEGASFELLVVGNSTNGNPNEVGGVVIQYPVGFTPLSVWAVNPNGDAIGFFNDAPAMLGLYTSEPGHALLSCSNSNVSGTSFALRVAFDAPMLPQVGSFKVALAADQNGALVAQDPAGVTNFAQINGANELQVQIIAAGAAGAPAWTDESNGLPLPDAGGWSGLALGDVDADGLMDIACLSLGGGPRVFRRGQGAALWTEASTGLATGALGGQAKLAFGDFDGDGNLDLVDGHGRAFLGDGASNWTPASTGLPMFGYEGVDVGDINNDGFDDLVFSAAQQTDLRFFLSNGDGTWTESSGGLPAGQFPPGGRGAEVLLIDLDRDQRLDILWGASTGPRIFLGDGVGNWVESFNHGLPAVPIWAFRPADFDADGGCDLVAALYTGGAGPLPQGVRVYRQTGIFPPQWTEDLTSGLPTANDYASLAYADLDGDGIEDLVAGRSGRLGNGSSGLELYRGLGAGAFAAAPAFSSGLPAEWISDPLALAFADLNDDRVPELVMASRFRGISALRNLFGSSLGAPGDGTLGLALGLPRYDLLSVNGSTGAPSRVVPVPLGQPVTLGLGQPPSNPNPANFILSGAVGAASLQSSFPSALGTFAFAPALLVPIPGLFTLANSFVPFSAEIPAGPTPFSANVGPFPVPATFSLQALVVESGGANSSIAISNAVVIQAR